MTGQVRTKVVYSDVLDEASGWRQRIVLHRRRYPFSFVRIAASSGPRRGARSIDLYQSYAPFLNHAIVRARSSSCDGLWWLSSIIRDDGSRLDLRANRYRGRCGVDLRFVDADGFSYGHKSFHGPEFEALACAIAELQKGNTPT